MADEPTNGELGRLIESFRHDTRADFDVVNRRLDTFVLREVYTADEARRETQFAAIWDEIKRIRTTRNTMITLLFSAFMGPIIVGLIVFTVTKGF